VVTPAQLAFVARVSGWFNRLRQRRKGPVGGDGTPALAQKSSPS